MFESIMNYYFPDSILKNPKLAHAYFKVKQILESSDRQKKEINALQQTTIKEDESLNEDVKSHSK
jgi:hypothetical protein